MNPSLLALLAATAVLYLWSLSTNGWGNDFYAAAAQAGSQSWKAFLFGSSDAGNTITVDKPPLSLWPMALSIRLFGLSSWSVLVPQAVMGVVAVGVMYVAVRRWFGAGAGLLSGAVLALTPVAALMFRFDNPDALLTLLLSVAALTALRAIDEDRIRWYALTGVLVGLGFLTKQLQAFLVVPGFALVLLVAGQGSPWRRIRGLAIAGASLVVSAGWWVALAELWPADTRPYIGGSEGNSFLQLTFGYNGFGRITGQGSGPGGGFGGGPSGSLPTGGFGGGPPGGGGGPFSAARGIGRMLDGANGGQIAWLLPAALVALAVGLVLTFRRPRTDLQRASLLLWGSWLFVTGAVFSYMSGIYHEYYTVALAPPVAALVGIGAALWWQHRDRWWAMATAAGTVALSTVWARQLLGRAPEWNSWLVTIVTVAGALATLTLSILGAAAARSVRRDRDGTLDSFTGPQFKFADTDTDIDIDTDAAPEPGAAEGTTGRHPPDRRTPPRLARAAAVGLTLVALLAGPAAWTAQTVATARSGPIVQAGPSTFGAGPGGGPQAGGSRGGIAGGPTGGSGGRLPGGPVAGGAPPGGGGPALPGGGLPAGFGGPGTDAAPSRAVLDKLNENADAFEWVAATMSATGAAPYQLATERAVVPIGGFGGGDPAPTLEQFQRLVAERRIHWFIAGGRGPGGVTGAGGSSAGPQPPGAPTGGTAGGPGGLGGVPSQGGGRPNFPASRGTVQEISTWVAEHFTPVTVDGVTLYDLTAPTAPT